MPSPRSASVRSRFPVFKNSELEFIMRPVVSVFVQRKINISHKPSVMAVTGRVLVQFGPYRKDEVHAVIQARAS